MRTRSWVVALVLAGCSFDPEPAPEEDDPGSDAGIDDPDPTASCGTTDPAVRLCLDFEDARDPMPTQVLDGSSHGNHAATTDVTSTTHDRGSTVEQAIRFPVSLTAPPSRLDIAASPALDITERVTMEMWVRLDQGSPPAVSLRHWLVDRNGQYFMSIGFDRQLTCGYNVVRVVDTETQLETTTNAWQHVACTIDMRPDKPNERELKVYIDGQLGDCAKYNEPIASRAGGTSIGLRHGSGDITEQFVGSADNVRIYDRALSPAEICTLAGRTGCNDGCPGGGQSGN